MLDGKYPLGAALAASLDVLYKMHPERKRPEEAAG
jgi:hypothetical protein